jgi:vitamin B12 transporter
MAARVVVTAAWLLCWASLARAQEPRARASVSRADAAAAADADADYSARARVTRPIATANRVDPTAAGTEIDLAERNAAYETLEDVLLAGPGSHALRSGWLGSYTSVSLRGAEAGHTSVLIGDVPVSSTDAAAFDLGTLPVELFDRVSVFRGGAPLWFAQTAIGGVIQLAPRSARGNLLSATGVAGSFDTYGGSLSAAVVPDAAPVRLLASAGALGTAGDFAYLYDNRTPLLGSDDRITRRNNADMLQGHGLLHTTIDAGPGELNVFALGFERSGGEPGAPADPANLTRRKLARGVGAAAYTLRALDGRGERRYELQAVASLTLARATFSDRYGELSGGLTQESESDTRDLFGRLAARAAATRFLEAALVATARTEQRSTEDPFARLPLPGSTRHSFFAGAELRAHGTLFERQVELRPSIRVEHQNAMLNSERFGALVETDVDDTQPTYRIGAAAQLFPDLTLAASIATGLRTPSMIELFGDGVLVRGNTGLHPERSTSVDVGLIDVTCAGDFSGTFEARVFDLAIEDQIIFLRDSMSKVFAKNLERSHTQGLELGAHASYTRHLELAAAATLLDAEGKLGKRLPNRPRAVLYGSPTLSSGRLGAFDALRTFFGVSYDSGSFEDPDNATQPKPSQVFVELGGVAVFLREHAELRVTVSDLFDRGGLDLRRFPLPGRTVMASFTYREDEP